MVGKKMKKFEEVIEEGTLWPWVVKQKISHPIFRTKKSNLISKQKILFE